MTFLALFSSVENGSSSLWNCIDALLALMRFGSDNLQKLTLACSKTMDYKMNCESLQRNHVRRLDFMPRPGVGSFIAVSRQISAVDSVVSFSNKLISQSRQITIICAIQNHSYSLRISWYITTTAQTNLFSAVGKTIRKHYSFILQPYQCRLFFCACAYKYLQISHTLPPLGWRF